MLRPLLEENELHDQEVTVAAQIFYRPQFLMTPIFYFLSFI